MITSAIPFGEPPQARARQTNLPEGPPPAVLDRALRDGGEGDPFEEDPATPAYYESQPSWNPAPSGITRGAFYDKNGEVGDIPSAAIGPFVSQGDGQTTYVQDDFRFSTSTGTPHLMDASLHGENSFVEANVIVPVVDGLEITIENADVLSATDTSYQVIYDATVGGLNQGTLTLSWVFSQSFRPKVSAHFEPVAGGSLETASLAWMVIVDPAKKYLKATNDMSDDATMDLEEDFPELTELEWASEGKHALLGNAPLTGDWTDSLDLSWEAEGPGELWVGPVEIDAEHTGVGIQVIFAPGDHDIDPDMSFGSTTVALEHGTQRRSFNAMGRYWVFSAVSTEIVYSSSTDGLDWSGWIALGARRVSDIYFDVFQSGSTVLVAWLEYGAAGYYKLAAKFGTVLADQITWSDKQVFSENLVAMYPSKYNTISAAIGSDGHLWVAVNSYVFDGCGWLCSAWFVRVFKSNLPLPDTTTVSQVWRNCDPVGGACRFSDSTAVQVVPRSEGAITILAATNGNGALKWIHFAPTTGWSVGETMPWHSAPGVVCSSADCLQSYYQAVRLAGDRIAVAFIDSTHDVSYAEINSGATQLGPMTQLQTVDDSVHVSIGKDAFSNPFVAWVRIHDSPGSAIRTSTIEYTKRLMTRSTPVTYSWSTVSVIFGPDQSVKGEEVRSVHLPEAVGPALLALWRSHSMFNRVSWYKIQYRLLQLPLGSSVLSTNVWSTEGITPAGSYVANHGYQVSTTTGQLLYRTLDFDLPARGLPLQFPRIYESPHFFDNSVNPLGYEDNPYTDLGDGWGLDYPWVSESFIHLPGGGKIPYSFDGQNVFESKAVIPFKASRTGAGDLITLSFSSGVKMELTKRPDWRDPTRSNFLVRYIWDNPSYGGNKLQFNYFQPGTPNQHKLSAVVDPTGRELILVYPVAGGHLERISYSSGPGLVSNVAWFEYCTDADPVEMLCRVKDADNEPPVNGQNVEIYVYASSIDPILLTQITFRETGYVTFGYCSTCQGLVQAGTDARVYPVDRIDLIGWDAAVLGAPSESLVALTMIYYDILNGMVRHARVWTWGPTGYSIQEVSVSPLRGYAVAFARDESKAVVKKDVVWNDRTGTPWKIEHYLSSPGQPITSRSSATSVEYVAADDWGNPIYARDAVGHEVFTSYLNTNSDGAFRGAPALVPVGSQAILVDRFETWAPDGWVLGTPCGLDNCMSLAAPYYDPPSLAIASPNGAYGYALRHFPPATSVNVDLIFQIPTADRATYSIELSDSTLARTRAKLTLVDTPTYGEFALNTCVVSGCLPLGILASGKWHRLTLRMAAADGTYHVNVDGTYLGLAYPYVAEQPGTAHTKDTIMFTADTTNGNFNTNLLVNELIISQGSSLNEEATISGLPPDAVVGFFDPFGQKIGAVREGSPNSASATVTLRIPGSVLSSITTVLVRSREQQVVINVPMTLFHGETFRLTRAPTVAAPFMSIEAGFGRSRAVITTSGLGPPGTQDFSSAESYWSVSDAAQAAVGSEFGRSLLSPGDHSHWFVPNPHALQPPRWEVSAGEFLIQYVFIPENRKPAQLMLEYRRVVDSNWVRAYWGEDKIGATGSYCTYGGPSDCANHRMGSPVDLTGRWQQFMVRVDSLDLTNAGLTSARQIDGLRMRLYGGAADWDHSSIGDAETGSLRIENIGSTQRVEFYKPDGKFVTSATPSSGDGLSRLNLYDAGISVFPIRGYFKVVNVADGIVEYVSPLMDSLWGGELLAYKRYEYYQGAAVPPSMRHRPLALISWDEGREQVNLDMETRTYAAPYRILDLSGSFRDGEFSGNGQPSFTSGIQGKGLFFDGTSAALKMTTPESTASGSFGASVWVRPISLQRSAPTNVMSAGDPGSSSTPWFVEIIPTTSSGDPTADLVAHFRFTLGELQLELTDAIQASPCWNHITVSFDGYRVLVGVATIGAGTCNSSPRFKTSTPAEGNALLTNTGTFFLGRSSPAAAQCPGALKCAFYGTMDEFKLYARGLSEDRVRQLWALEKQALVRMTGLATKTLFKYSTIGLPLEERRETTASITPSSEWPWLRTEWTYDSTYKVLTAKKNEAGQTLTFSYTQATNVKFAYISSVSASIAGDSRTRSFEYDVWGRVVAEISPAPDSAGSGYRTEFAYDTIGRLKEVRHPAYDGPDANLAGTHPTERWAYDDQGRTVTWTAPSGWMEKTVTNGLGLVSLSYRTYASGVRYQTWQYRYNHQGQVVKTYGPAYVEQRWDVAYDALGRVTSMSGPAVIGNRPTAEYGYDDLVGLAWYKDPEGAYTVAQNDLRGRTTASCQWSSKSPVEEPEDCFGSTHGAVVSSEYDLAGQLVRRFDAEGGVREWAYDLDGRLTRAAYADDSFESYGLLYDRTQGKIVHSVTNLAGDMTSRTYDGLGELVEVDYPDHDLADSEAYEYDGLGRLRHAENENFAYRFTYNSWNQITQKKITYPVIGFLVMDLEYDQYGRLAKMSYPKTLDSAAPDGIEVEYAFASSQSGGNPGDSFDRLRSVSFPGGGYRIYDYDHSDKLTYVRFGNFPDLYVRNNRDYYGRIEKTTVDPHSTPNLREFSYEYRMNGQLKKETTQKPGMAPSTELYTYDDVGRLYRYGPAGSTTTITYDNNGNRESLTPYAGGPVTEYGYGGGSGVGDLLTSVDVPSEDYTSERSYTPDGVLDQVDENGGGTAEGGATYDYKIDGANRIFRVDYMTPGFEHPMPLAFYSYGPDGEMLHSQEEDLQKYYFVFGGQVIFSWNGEGTDDYIYANGQVIATLHNAGSPNYVIQDSQGNTRLILTVTAGYAIQWEAKYSPFGEATVISDQLTGGYDFRFAGNNERESVKLNFFHARWYEPSTGRFLSRDPVETFDVHSMAPNLYAYGRDDPKTQVDKSGTTFWAVAAFILISALIGGAASVAYYHITTPGDLRTEQGYWNALSFGLISGAMFASLYLAVVGAATLAVEGVAAARFVELSAGQSMIVGGSSGALGATVEETVTSVASGSDSIDVGEILLAAGLGVVFGWLFKEPVRKLQLPRERLPTPQVKDARLQGSLESLYSQEGQTGFYGRGTTADAVRWEWQNGKTIYGKLHFEKADNSIGYLKGWLRKNPNADPADRAAAQQVMDDLYDALKVVAWRGP